MVGGQRVPVFAPPAGPGCFHGQTPPLREEEQDEGHRSKSHTIKGFENKVACALTKRDRCDADLRQGEEPAHVEVAGPCGTPPTGRIRCWLASLADSLG